MALDRMLQIVFFLSVTYTIAFASPAEDCGSEAGKFTKVSLSGCPDSAKECVLKRGTNATLNIVFTTNATQHNVTAYAYGDVEGYTEDIDLPHPDGCTKSGLTCPLQPGHVYHYYATLPVDKSYPAMSLTIQYELNNYAKSNSNIICLRMPVKLI
ncbi:hypothetical protein C0J52_09215 [Blattella germanica]|nr:hypothetical protein C0J52_09215 [Blattella germanica]